MTRLSAVGFAIAASALAGSVAATLAYGAGSRLAGRLGPWALRVMRAAEESIAPLRRAGSEGIDPTRAQRRRLRFAFGLAALPLGWVTADLLAAVALAALAAFLSSRVLVWRRERYVRRLGEGAGGAGPGGAGAPPSGRSPP